MFLTVVNVAVDGFDKDFQYITDPNSTVRTRYCYNRQISRGASTSQKLQTPVGYQFITTNVGFTHIKSKITRTTTK